jgi:hypothetical protein
MTTPAGPTSAWIERKALDKVETAGKFAWENVVKFIIYLTGV